MFTGCKNRVVKIQITGIWVLFNLRNEKHKQSLSTLFKLLIWFCFVSEQYNTYEEINVSILANATIFAKTVSKTDQVLLLLITVIGGVDIVLLAAYVVMCIYDRTGREKTVDFFSQGNSTLYENVSFSVFDNN